MSDGSGYYSLLELNCRNEKRENLRIQIRYECDVRHVCTPCMYVCAYHVCMPAPLTFGLENVSSRGKRVEEGGNSAHLRVNLDELRSGERERGGC